MAALRYAKPERVTLAGHSELNERWVQARIAEDPSILGLGNLALKDKERRQPTSGRLDLLCRDAEADPERWYEIEVQLGKTDESHIIRTIEYWDIERKRYPDYHHVGVLVAEEITGRFLNVVSLFNGSIPLVAIQMRAFKIGDQISLVFTTVLSEMSRGTEEDEEDEPADRGYWEKRGSRNTLEMTDTVYGLVKTIDPELSLKYNKFYVGLAKNGVPSNFVIFRPKKDWVRLGNSTAPLGRNAEEAGGRRRGCYGLRHALGTVSPPFRKG
jgi:hypothetical protein